MQSNINVGPVKNINRKKEAPVVPRKRPQLINEVDYKIGSFSDMVWHRLSNNCVLFSGCIFLCFDSGNAGIIKYCFYYKLLQH